MCLNLFNFIVLCLHLFNFIMVCCIALLWTFYNGRLYYGTMFLINALHYLYMQVDMSLNSSDDSSSSIDSELDDYDDLMDLVLIMTIMEYEQSFIDKTPCRTSMLTGKMYTIEFLVGHETRCYENFRMKKDVFMNFCETLKEVGNLCDGKKVSIEEAVAMFLIIICHNLRHRVVAERFQHSLHTVS